MEDIGTSLMATLLYTHIVYIPAVPNVIMPSFPTLTSFSVCLIEIISGNWWVFWMRPFFLSSLACISSSSGESATFNNFSWIHTFWLQNILIHGKDPLKSEPANSEAISHLYGNLKNRFWSSQSLPLGHYYCHFSVFERKWHLGFLW